MQACEPLMRMRAARAYTTAVIRGDVVDGASRTLDELVRCAVVEVRRAVTKTLAVSISGARSPDTDARYATVRRVASA